MNVSVAEGLKMSLRVKRVKVVREDCARSEYAAGATWHDLHAFASAHRRDREERQRRAVPRPAQSESCSFPLIISLVVSRCYIVAQSSA